MDMPAFPFSTDPSEENWNESSRRGILNHFSRVAPRDSHRFLRLIKTPEIREVYATYLKSLERIDQLMDGLIKAVYWSGINGRIAGTIKTSLLRSASYAMPSDEEIEEQDNRRSEFLRYFNALDNDQQDFEKRFFASHYISAVPPFERLESTLQSIHYTMLMNAYSAFETLAGDLWEVAVNLDPELSRGNNPKASYSFDELFQNDFEVRSKLGSLLKQKQNFDSLKDLKICYKSTYPSRTEDENKVEYYSKTQTIFQVFSDETSIYKLNLVRNLIAHKAGAVDAVFLDSVRNYEEFRHAKLNEYIEIDGILAYRLIMPSIETSERLVQFVDNQHSLHLQATAEKARRKEQEEERIDPWQSVEVPGFIPPDHTC